MGLFDVVRQLFTKRKVEAKLRTGDLQIQMQRSGSWQPVSSLSPIDPDRSSMGRQDDQLSPATAAHIPVPDRRCKYTGTDRYSPIDPGVLSAITTTTPGEDDVRSDFITAGILSEDNSWYCSGDNNGSSSDNGSAPDSGSSSFDYGGGDSGGGGASGDW